MSRSPGPLVVRFLNVGQGDAAIVFLPNSTRALVMDAFDGNAVVTALASRNVDEIVVFFTHSDDDHVQGARDLLTNFQNTGGRLVAIFYNLDRLLSYPGSDYRAYLRTLLNATRNSLHVEPWAACFDTNLLHDNRFPNLVSYPVKLDVLHPTYTYSTGLSGHSLNDQSGVLRVVYHPRRKPARAVLFTGDVQLTGISLMFEEHQADLSVLRADVLKFPHHGAWPTTYTGSAAFNNLQHRSMADFLSAVDPRLVVVSVGFGNRDTHVRPDVFTALQTLAGNGRLARIACTQFTRTCTTGQVDPMPTHCAGDVTVTFHPDPGMDVTPTEASHTTRIRLHTAPSVAGCTPLLSVPAPPALPSPSPPPGRSIPQRTRSKKSSHP